MVGVRIWPRWARRRGATIPIGAVVSLAHTTAIARFLDAVRNTLRG